MHFGKKILASQDEKYNFINLVASGKFDFQQIVAWIKHRTKKN